MKIPAAALTVSGAAAAAGGAEYRRVGQTDEEQQDDDCLVIRVASNVVSEEANSDGSGSDGGGTATSASFVTAASHSQQQEQQGIGLLLDHLPDDLDLRSIVVEQSQQEVPAWYNRCLLCDDRAACRLKGLQLAEGPAFVRFAKFVGLSFAGIGAMFHLVRWLNWEHDATLRLRDVWRYEGNLIATDSLFYFCVGRLWRQRGVDHPQWLFVCLASMLYSSAITNFAMFQHSVTLYEMHCRWPWQLWAFAVLTVPLIVGVAVAHLLYACRRGLVVQKCLEMAFCLTFLLLPLVTSSYFHLHHWFAGLLVGMHCNYADAWWSRAALAWCWGAYLNGIAVYGRDPVLTCEYALFVAVTQRCPFVDCYVAAMLDPDHLLDNATVVDEMKPPDWRNCSADAYHP